MRRFRLLLGVKLILPREIGSTGCLWVKKLIDIVELYKNGSESLRSHSGSRREELHRWTYSERCSKRHHNKYKNKKVKPHSPPSISSKEKYNTRSESESEEKECSMNKRHNRHFRVQDSRNDSELSVGRYKKSRHHQNRIAVYGPHEW